MNKVKKARKRFLSILIAAMMIFGVSVTASAADRSPVEKCGINQFFSKGTYTNPETGAATPFLFHKALGKQPMPLIVYRHGSWANGSIGRAAWETRTFVFTLLLRGHRFNLLVVEGSEDPGPLIEWAKMQANVDDDRIYGVGYSAGAWNLISEVTNHSDRYAAVVLLDGGQAAPAPMPQWIFWNDLGYPEDGINALRKQGVDVHATNVAGGHDVILQQFPRIREWDKWLFNQHK